MFKKLSGGRACPRKISARITSSRQASGATTRDQLLELRTCGALQTALSGDDLTQPKPDIYDFS